MKEAKPLPQLNIVRNAVIGMILLLNALYFSGVLTSNTQRELNIPTTTTHVIFGVLLVAIYIVASKLASAQKQITPGVTLLLYALFEFAGLLGFATVFMFQTGTYLIIGSIYAIIGILIVVPQLQSNTIK